jgi:excisionase family DNA binding protein
VKQGVSGRLAVECLFYAQDGALKIEGRASVAKKRVEIIIETERTLLISARSNDSICWCEACARRVLMLTTEEAAAVMRVPLDEILRKIEASELHFVRPPRGGLRVCSNSLLR